MKRENFKELLLLHAGVQRVKKINGTQEQGKRVRRL